MKLEYTAAYNDQIKTTESNIEAVCKWADKHRISSYMVQVTIWDVDSINDDGTPDIICQVSLDEIENQLTKYGYFDPLNMI